VLPESTERFAIPSSPVLKLMRRHLCEEHGYSSFLLERDLYLGGAARSEAQILTWNPTKASFLCDLCPGLVFGSGQLTEAMIRKAQLFDLGLAPFLVGLTDEADRDEMTRRYLEGSVNQERLRHLRGADAKRRASRGKRPGVEERRERLQSWMLSEVRRRGGVLERVLDEADRLQRHDPDAWRALSDRNLSRETLRDYWQDIPPTDREAARSDGHKQAEKSTR
jgi:hypothetical protein